MIIRYYFLMMTVKKTRDGLNEILQAVPKIYKIQSINLTIRDILTELVSIINSSDAFILVDNIINYEYNNIDGNFFSGIGIFESGINTISHDLLEHINYCLLYTS